MATFPKLISFFSLKRKESHSSRYFHQQFVKYWPGAPFSDVQCLLFGFITLNFSLSLAIVSYDTEVVKASILYKMKPAGGLVLTIL